jgi:hypothetical protein
MHFTPAYLDVGFDELELAEQDGRALTMIIIANFAAASWMPTTRGSARQYRRMPAEYWDTFMPGPQPEWGEPARLDRPTCRGRPEGGTPPSPPCSWLIHAASSFDPPLPWAMYKPESVSILPG